MQTLQALQKLWPATLELMTLQNSLQPQNNRAVAEMTIKQLGNWDNELQLTEVEAGDRNDVRPNAVNF